MRLEDDPRWQKINSPDWTCKCCGRSIGGLPDLHFGAPASWSDDKGGMEPNDAVLDDRDVLTEDFCKLGEHRMVRCILPMDIIGGQNGERFAYGVWGSLKPENFMEMLEHFNFGQGELGPYFSWLSNILPNAPRESVACRMYPQPDRQRPILRIEDETHPYHRFQNEGITLDEVLELLALGGLDFRSHLNSDLS